MLPCLQLGEQERRQNVPPTRFFPRDSHKSASELTAKNHEFYDIICIINIAHMPSRFELRVSFTFRRGAH